MSLLIEALKQAEASQRAAQAADNTSPADAPLQLETIEPPVSAAAPAPRAQAVRTAATSTAAAARSTARTPQREAAQALFDIKRKPPRHTPLIIALAGLLLLLAGTAYIGWATQISNGVQPGSSLGTLAPSEPLAASVSPVSETASLTKTATTPLAQEPLQKPVRKAPRSKPSPTIALQEDLPETPAIRRSTGKALNDSPNTLLQQAFNAYSNGQLAQAQQAYLGVLQTEAKNLDALNALAMLAQRAGRPAEAEAYYRQALTVDPKNAMARAQLSLLQADSDPLKAESRLRQLLAEQPESSTAFFALGSVYAQQNNWGGAQQAFFRAHSLEPGNADTLYNLAVSLDHLKQAKLARDYYERAALASTGRPVAFDPAAARIRATQLTAATANP